MLLGRLQSPFDIGGLLLDGRGMEGTRVVVFTGDDQVGLGGTGVVEPEFGVTLVAPVGLGIRVVGHGVNLLSG
jgi:hypothetical protein